MMKIIHCADLHIDSKMESNLSKEQAHERKNELLLTFERVVEYANQNSVKAIIIAGDMFDTSKVSSKSKDRIFNIIKSNSQIDFLYLSGNHDEDSIISQVCDMDNLKIFGDSWTHFDYGDIVITGVRSNASNKIYYDALNLDKDKVNIVVLHGEFSKSNLKEDTQIISLKKLQNKNIDYLALGHIHSFQSGKIDARGIFCYSGCLEGRGFDECGDKGFVLIDIENKNLKYEFVPFAKKKLFEINFDITGKKEWFEIEKDILKNLETLTKNDLVKIVLNGKYELSLIKQIDILTAKLNDLCYFAKIEDKSVLQVNLEDYKNDKSLRGEFIRSVLTSDLEENEKEQIIIMGLKALGGEDLK